MSRIQVFTALAVSLQITLGFLVAPQRRAATSSVLHAYKKEVPPLVHSSKTHGSTFSSLNQLLPLEPTDPKLFTGRWEIKTSNELSSELGGFGLVEIDAEDGTFTARGRRKNDEGLLSSTFQVSRNGSFSLLGLVNQATDNGAVGLKEEPPVDSGDINSLGGDNKVVGVLQFQADETEHVSTSVGGVGLPTSMLNRRTAVRDLSGKERVVHVKVVDLDTIILLFLEQSKFYVLVRSTAASNTAAEVTPATPINVVLITQLVSLVASALAEGLRADLLHLFK